uniref:N-acetyltransferase domain-containing protein n=1 Tax=Chromera velia CCMP2878 TaxID=1169474 RepID=A0A0G4HCV2_9ALVE|eukprot:Cvel_26321.t1-p1 / transcript=Cvel_26321.t1 / gene=Cvel_26321 / organism=Chromera_velia_CCMP2878 / gene_product=Putative ribosomal-protein-alanine, putative / transcript_product=Putative ribosomal-protein-alanine, putative / location=Cvel_scaffold3111:15829-16938(-) / protein_length=370 / sequence_SO=supercontig / SO=protein_coding / is_pseudo=false
MNLQNNTNTSDAGGAGAPARATSAVVLQGRRCLLRPFRQSDAESLVENANSHGLKAFMPDNFPQPYTHKHADAFISSVSHSSEHFAIAVLPPPSVRPLTASSVHSSPGSDAAKTDKGGTDPVGPDDNSKKDPGTAKASNRHTLPSSSVLPPAPPLAVGLVHSNSSPPPLLGFAPPILETPKDMLQTDIAEPMPPMLGMDIGGLGMPLSLPPPLSNASAASATVSVSVTENGAHADCEAAVAPNSAATGEEEGDPSKARDGSVIGCLFFSEVVPGDPTHRHCRNLGFWIGSEYWGRGVGTEAVALGLRYAFGFLRLHRVQAVVRDGNTGSLRVLEKNGFRREGILREALLMDGAFHDAAFLSRLEADASLV